MPISQSYIAEGLVEVMEHTWGEDTSLLEPPFDLVVACGKSLRLLYLYFPVWVDLRGSGLQI